MIDMCGPLENVASWRLQKIDTLDAKYVLMSPIESLRTTILKSTPQ